MARVLCADGFLLLWRILVEVRTLLCDAYSVRGLGLVAWRVPCFGFGFSCLYDVDISPLFNFNRIFPPFPARAETSARKPLFLGYNAYAVGQMFGVRGKLCLAMGPPEKKHRLPGRIALSPLSQSVPKPLHRNLLFEGTMLYAVGLMFGVRGK